MDKKLLGLQGLLRESGILISFSGKFSQGIIEELGEAVKKHMESEEMPKNDTYNVFAIFIEQTQNIKNYTLLKESTPAYDKVAGSGIVSIGKCSEGYFIWSGNMIENTDADKLSKQLDSLITLDKDSLKKLYKEQLKKEVEPGSLGAGIGLIDIARKASLPIKYTIEKMDDNFSFFEIKVIV